MVAHKESVDTVDDSTGNPDEGSIVNTKISTLEKIKSKNMCQLLPQECVQQLVDENILDNDASGKRKTLSQANVQTCMTNCTCTLPQPSAMTS